MKRDALNEKNTKELDKTCYYEMQSTVDKKSGGVSLERRDQDGLEKSELDVDLMDGCLGVVEILQQRLSLLLSNVHLILQIPSIVSARLSSLISVCSLHFP